MQTKFRFPDEGFQFLMNHLRVGLTFVRIAEKSDDPISVDRCKTHARKAYDTAVNFAGQMSFIGYRATAFHKELAELQEGLRRLGERL